MPSGAKALVIRPVGAPVARQFIRRNHYSGKVVNNSQLHLGAFLGVRLVGVGSFGPPMDRAKVLPLVRGTEWYGMLELNRLAFIDDTPRNSESRFLAICMRLIRKHYPRVGWVLTYADATQCGDGTIYRAAGFRLVGIKRSANLRQHPQTGEVVQSVAAYMRKMESEWRTWPKVPGFQIQYIRFLDPTLEKRLTVPILDYGDIEAAGAAMYLGQRAGSIESDASAIHAEEGGANPTSALHTIGVD